MKGEEFLKLGESLLNQRGACNCRAAISRAYYGVLNATAQLMRSSGLDLPKRNEIHQKLWQDLLNCGIPELRLPGSQLSELHGVRIQADYEMDNDDPEDFETARLWVNEARTHLTAIQQAFAGAERQKVVAAIRGYRKTVGR